MARNVFDRLGPCVFMVIAQNSCLKWTTKFGHVEYSNHPFSGSINLSGFLCTARFDYKYYPPQN